SQVIRGLVLVSTASGAAYAAAAAMGLLHGIDPGHGWPVAAAYALGRRRTWSTGAAAGAILGVGHLLSSFAVVAGFELLARWVDLRESGWIATLAGFLLIGLGAVQWIRAKRHHHAHAAQREGSGDGSRSVPAASGESLWVLAAFAFLLGFAHEEEIAILALCAGRGSCWAVMATYALTVAGLILGLTLLSIAVLDRFRARIDPWHERLPRMSAAILIVMGVLYAAGVL
ncbi:MAG: hypothetical protein LC798_18265, partial [Chloroflexi bacterium]|nr:hypothetical protein [Chloroflexota bacterium]